MKINKVNLTNYLEMNGIDVSDMKWNELLSTYKKHKKDNETTITKDDIVNVVDKFVEEVEEPKEILQYDNDKLRNQLIIDIIKFVKVAKGRTRLSSEEITLMFSLYNNFYKRNESPGCSTCGSNVFTKLKRISKKYRD